jgi:hypothetical protein
VAVKLPERAPVPALAAYSRHGAERARQVQEPVPRAWAACDSQRVVPSPASACSQAALPAAQELLPGRETKRRAAGTLAMGRSRPEAVAAQESRVT